MKSVLVLAFALVLTGCSREETVRQPSGATSLRVETETVKETPWVEFHEAAGTVRARNTAVLAARVPGTITAVHVRAGDPVRLGQTLASLDGAELDAQLRRAQAGHAASQSGVLEAQRGLESAEAGAQLAAATYRRYRDLLARQSVSPQEYEEMEARHKSAQAALAMAQARAEQARSRVDQAGAELAAARTVRNYTAIVAPFSGVVAERKADPGTVAFPGLPILVVEDTAQYRLEVAVEESRAAGLRLGQEVPVLLADRELAARLDEIAGASDPATRTVLVKLALPAASNLRSGLFARARFKSGERPAMTVPAAAVKRRGQLESVFVLENGKLWRRLVTLGRESGGRVEALSGLNAGERVVTRWTPELNDGAPAEARP
jgi:multidrug efflux pump subunit AcrA (membrane-fusion protein)